MVLKKQNVTKSERNRNQIIKEKVFGLNLELTTITYWNHHTSPRNPLLDPSFSQVHPLKEARPNLTVGAGCWTCRRSLRVCLFGRQLRTLWAYGPGREWVDEMMRSGVVGRQGEFVLKRLSLANICEEKSSIDLTVFPNHGFPDCAPIYLLQRRSHFSHLQSICYLFLPQWSVGKKRLEEEMSM